MAFKNSSNRSLIKLMESTRPYRKFAETGLEMEDSGIHLDDSPTFFSGGSKVMTYPCPSGRKVTVTSAWTTEAADVSTNLHGDETGNDSIVGHDDTSRDLHTSSSNSYFTSTLRVISQGQGGRTTVTEPLQCSADLSTSTSTSTLTQSSTPVRLKQRQSTGEVASFHTGSDPDIDLDPVKVEPSSLTEDVFLSAPETPVLRSSKDKSPAGLTKLQKFFEPLRRSRSTGNTKDQKEEQTLSSFFRSVSKKEERLSADTGNGSMDSELDHESDDPSRLDRTKLNNLSSEMKERFSMFMRQGDPSGPFKDTGRREKMTLEAVTNWSKSFEHLLTDKNGLRWFREFLKSEFSEENIEFWIACDEYKHLKTHKMASQAHKIFMQFVAYQAPREINIDSTTRDLTYDNMKHPEVTTFEAAQKRIESLMGKDSYPRFIESDLYSHLLSGFKSS